MKVEQRGIGHRGVIQIRVQENETRTRLSDTEKDRQESWSGREENEIREKDEMVVRNICF